MTDLIIPWGKIIEDLELPSVDNADPLEGDPDNTPKNLMMKFVTVKHLGVTHSSEGVTLTTDFICRPQTKRLEEDLAIYGRAEDIVKVHNERPDLLRATKSSDECDGDCEACDPDTGSSCSQKSK